MDTYIKNAMKAVGMFKDGNTFYSLISLQESILTKRQSELKYYTSFYLTLVRHLPESLLGDSHFLGREKYDAFRRSLSSITYNGDKDTVSLVIATPTSICIKTFLDQVLQDIFEGCGFCETKSDFEYINVREIEISRKNSHFQFLGCSIGIRSLQNEEYEIMFIGSSAIVALLHYYEKMVDIIFREVIIVKLLKTTIKLQ